MECSVSVSYFLVQQQLRGNDKSCDLGNEENYIELLNFLAETDKLYYNLQVENELLKCHKLSISSI